VREEGRESREEAEDKEGLGSLILYIKLISSSCWMFGCVACQQTRSFFYQKQHIGLLSFEDFNKRAYLVCTFRCIHVQLCIHALIHTHMQAHTNTHTHTQVHSSHTQTDLGR
jgi:hypothetical protein